MTTPLSCYILTYNSARRIGAAIESVAGVADEIVILDSGSSDATEQICRSLGVRFETRRFDDFGRQRAHAISLCSYPWNLSIDSDETLSPALQARLLALKDNDFRLGDQQPDGFSISRRWFAFDQELHCFYPCVCPDHPVRLLRGDKVRFPEDVHVHEAPRGLELARHLPEPIDHHTVDSIDQMFSKVNLYSSLAAENILKQEGRPPLWKVFVYPWLIWAQWYLVKGGWRDGLFGVIHGRYVRDTVYLKYLKAHMQAPIV
jgi:glycosyltransferase involved in cell wall biosynthesis